MSGPPTTPLFTMFPSFKGNSRLSADYSGARVVCATVYNQNTAMRLTLSLTEPAPPYEINVIEDLIAQELDLSSVSITTVYARATSESIRNPNASSGVAAASSVKPGAVILGNRTKVTLTRIEDITPELEGVAVRGEVCDVTSKFSDKQNAWYLSFDLTDYTGTIRVFKKMMNENASQITKKITKGMWLTVSGGLKYEEVDKRYDDSYAEPRYEPTLFPKNIVAADHEQRADTAEEKRVELHLHTKMSASDALTDTREVIRRAMEWGHPAIAITDHGVVHSFPEAMQAAEALGGKIKVIYGMEGYIVNDTDLSDSEKNASEERRERTKYRHIILLVKNKTGLNNLYKLVTKSHLEHFSRVPNIPKSLLDEHREGLIIGSACAAGELFRAVANKLEPEVLKKIAGYYDYLEIQPACNNRFMLYEDNPRASNTDDLREFNKRIVELGGELGIPVVATGDVHFLDPEHEIFRYVLLTSKGFESADEQLPIYFKPTDEMLSEFAYLGEETAYDVVVKNSKMIADMCEVIRPLPKKELFAPKLERSAEDLREIVFRRQRELYGENPPEIVTRRVDTELGDILDRGYDVIYMTAQKLVAGSIEHGYLVGSRGSVGSSIVAFLAGITEVNALPAHYRCPVCRNSDFVSGEGYGCGADMPDIACPVCGAAYAKDGFNIPFETFLGFDGDKVPDIDLNFSGEYQAQAHKHTMDLFGADYVFRAGTITTVAEKTAFGFVEKYVKSLGKTVTKAEERRLARGCVGVKRTTGQHPGGLIVIPQGMDITDFCPAQHPADDRDKGIITTHFDYHCMEDNLIKLDELGHDDPTMIRMLEDMTGIDARDIKFDDPGTMSIFTSPEPLGLPADDDIIGTTGSIGIPEFGTPLTRDMLRDTKPQNFDTLVRLSGYSHGTGVWLGNARELILSGKTSVSDTISCRDDIMLYLISKGMTDRYAFKISESIRKGYGLPDGAEDTMTSHRIPEWYIESCKRITYLFPKAHAVAYVMMAFRIAWFKVHKPLEFYSAYFYRRSQKDSFDAELMTRGLQTARRKIRELRNELKGSKSKENKDKKEEELLITLEACYEFYMRGFEFASIDLYDSDPVKFLITGANTIRPPFVAISGLGETAAYDIAENRAGREFISVDDVSNACAKVSKTHLEQLRAFGAMRDLPESSQLSLF